jgi:hypothetical protein
VIRAAGSLYLYNVDELLDGSRGPVQGGLLFRFQRDLDDLLDAVRAEFDRHAEELPLHAIVPFEIDGARQYLLFVLQYRLYSNVSRGKRRKAKGEDPLPLEEFGVPEDGRKKAGRGERQSPGCDPAVGGQDSGGRRWHRHGGNEAGRTARGAGHYCPMGR